MKRISTLLLILISTFCMAQTIPANRLVDWRRAGLPDTVPGYTTVVNIMNHGGNNSGTADNATAFQAALNSLNGSPGSIYFPAGSYRFEAPINMRDSLVIKGEGSQTLLRFSLGGSGNAINFSGNTSPLVTVITQPVIKNDSAISLLSAAGINIGDWLRIYGNDATLVTSTWALGTVGQIFQVKAIQGNTIISNQPFRRTYDLAFLPVLEHINPIKDAGVECMSIERDDVTAGQTSTINFNYAVNSWVVGVSSLNANFAHIAASYSAHLLVRGCFMKDAHDYGAGGKGYGVMLQLSTGDCRIEDNAFRHLRHAMILQAGANGNVFGYNYSYEPFWNEPPFPSYAAGDAVLHGNYVYANLFEGNILHNIAVDNSHGPNGPYNTFFRNRAIGYGIVHNTTQVTDTVNYIGNEIIGDPLWGSGLYYLTGVGHYGQSNNVKGTITPAGTNTISEFSLYLNRRFAYLPPPSWNDTTFFPNIGAPAAFNNTEGNPAKQRFDNFIYTDCTANPNYEFPEGAVANINTARLNLYPNPATNTVTFVYHEDITGMTLSIADISGRIVYAALLSSDGRYHWDCSNRPAGIYICTLMSEGRAIQINKLVITQ